MRDVIPRAARNAAVRPLGPVFDAQGAFGEFRRHAQKTCKDHPEGRARSADADCDGDTGDIAEAYGARERG